MTTIPTDAPTWPQELLETACRQPLHLQAVHGVELFNRGAYFEAHEALETAWRAEPGPQRELYRAVLLAGVALLHIQRNNLSGAVKVSQRCLRWLVTLPETCSGVHLRSLRHDIARVSAWLESLRPEDKIPPGCPVVRPIRLDLAWPVQPPENDPIKE